jgi:uncharacterized protein YrrD
VVTLAGEDIAEVRDVVYDPDRGGLVGFTLNKRTVFRGDLRQVLPISDVHSIGRDAIIVDSDTALTHVADAPAPMVDASPDRDVIGALVLTNGGTKLGAITDVIVSLGGLPHAVGYEVHATEGARHDGPSFIPLPEQLSISGDALIVPHEVDSFIRDDLSGFGAAVTEFRAQLGERSAPPAARPAGAAEPRSKGDDR